MRSRPRDKKGFITDARGRAVPVFRGESALPEHISRESAERIRNAYVRGYFGRWRWRALLLAAVAVAHTVLMLKIGRYVPAAWAGAGGWISTLFPAFAAGTLFILVWAALRYEQSLAVKRHTRALIADCICPACLYLLKGLPRQDDGCIVCPECGAAWKVAPIVSSVEVADEESTR